MILLSNSVNNARCRDYEGVFELVRGPAIPLFIPTGPTVALLFSKLVRLQYGSYRERWVHKRAPEWIKRGSGSGRAAALPHHYRYRYRGGLTGQK